MRKCFLFLIGIALASYASEDKPAHKGASRQPIQKSLCNDVPAHPFDLISEGRHQTP